MRTRDLYFKYPKSDRHAVRALNLDIKDGKITALMGENGSGKTTLLRLFAGLLEPTRGRIELDGKEIGFSPEDPELGFFARTVEKEVEFYPKNRGLDHEKMAEKSLKKLRISHLKDKLPFILSSGQQRLVSIASVVAGDPDVVLLDEPTHSLHRKGENKIGNVLKEVNRTIVFSTHSSEFTLNYADELVMMHEGRVLSKGKPEQLLGNEELLQEAGIRMPGIIRWAKERNLQNIPRDLDQALEIARDRGELE